MDISPASLDGRSQNNNFAFTHSNNISNSGEDKGRIR